MHAEREPVAGGADRRQHLRQLIAPIARHVQDRAELLALELVERRSSNICGGKKCPAAARPDPSSQAYRSFASLRMRSACRARRARAASEITGPTSVASSPGGPMRSTRIAPISISITRSAISSCRYSTRSAEQRWPALVNAEVTASSTTCSGSAVASTTMALTPPVSAISGTIGPSRWRACG